MGITKHNQEFTENPEDDSAFVAIFQALQVDVKSYIKNNFPKELMSTRQVTEFLNETFMTYRDKVASGPGPWSDFDTKRLKGYLRQIARRKLREAKRHELAESRDPSRVEQVPPKDISSDKSLNVSQIEVREVVKLISVELLNEKKEQDKLINLLSFGMQLSGREIEEVLREANGGVRCVSDSTILRVVARTKLRIAQLFPEHSGNSHD